MMVLNDDQMLSIILNEVIQASGVPLFKLMSYGANHRCDNKTSNARRVYFVLSKLMTTSSHNVIAAKINIDFSTVGHSVKQHYQWQYSFDSEYRYMFDKIKSKIESYEQEQL